MKSLWNSSEVAVVTGGQIIGSQEWNADGVSIDSRTVQPGDLFIAIVGPKENGHKYVSSALDRGAAGVLVSSIPNGLAKENIVLVSDTLKSFYKLAEAARKRSKAKVVAVTGSVGKTGTKEALRSALARDRSTHATTGNQNNEWGVPLSLARLPTEAKYAVFEIGMRRAGDIAPLSELVRPDIVIITTVEPVHLEFFESVNGIADAKAEIFSGIQSEGIAILNQDNPFFKRLANAAKAAGARVIGFGESTDAKARLIKIVAHSNCSCMSADICGQPMAVKVGIPGRHIVQNSLAVLAAVHSLGGDLGLAGVALANLSLLPGRGNRSKIVLDDGYFELIDETYNASPVSMRAAIKLLGDSKLGGTGRKIAVLGDMLELGSKSALLHVELAGAIVEAGIDIVFCSGTYMRHLAKTLPSNIVKASAPTSKDLIHDLITEIRPGDSVMVKGSLGSHMQIIIDHLTALELDSSKCANGA